jgi:hypothetical protein
MSLLLALLLWLLRPCELPERLHRILRGRAQICYKLRDTGRQESVLRRDLLVHFIEPHRLPDELLLSLEVQGHQPDFILDLSHFLAALLVPVVQVLHPKTGRQSRHRHGIDRYLLEFLQPR